MFCIDRVRVLRIFLVFLYHMGLYTMQGPLYVGNITLLSIWY